MISAADNTGWWLNVCVKHRAKEKNKNKKENKIKIGLFFQHGNVKDNLDKQGLMDLRLYWRPIHCSPSDVWWRTFEESLGYLLIGFNFLMLWSGARMGAFSNIPGSGPSHFPHFFFKKIKKITCV